MSHTIAVTPSVPPGEAVPGRKGPVDIPVFSILPPEPDARDRTQREYLDYEQRLTADIAKRGVLQPIYVFPLDQGYRALTGWSRVRASRNAGRQAVPAFILERSLSEAEQEMEKLLENEMRQNFTAFELGAIYLRLLKLNDWSQADLAREVSVGAGHVARTLSVSTRLHPDVRELLTKGLHPKAAYHVSRLPPDQQLPLATRAVQIPMDCESVAAAVKGLLGGKQRRPKQVKANADGATVIAPGDWTWEKVRGLAERLKAVAARGEKMGAPVSLLSSLLKGV